METWLYRHDEIRTYRPYAVDVDDDGWLWQGCGANRLVGHHLRTAALRLVNLPEMGDRPIFQVFAWGDQLVLVLGEAPFYLVYNRVSGHCTRRSFPFERAIVWYGTFVTGGKLLLYERTTSSVLVLDAPAAEPRVISCPYHGQLANGRVMGDGLVYSGLESPSRLVRFDPAAERFVDEIPCPAPERVFIPAHEHANVVYCTTTTGGQIYPFHPGERRWDEPIAAPDCGEVYGFIGAPFSFHGKMFATLSTYCHPSRLDPVTGKIIIPDGPLTLDGRQPRFLDRFLVFDPAAQNFEYLIAPPQPDGIPLLCYAWADDRRFAITGIVIPFDAPGEPGEQFGHWIVLQNEPAEDEPGFRVHDLNFDRAAHIGRYRRGYPAPRSLYIPQVPWTPPIANMHGPATEHLPGIEAVLNRRASKTDRQTYLRELALALTAGAAGDAERVQRIAGFLGRSLFYNPVQETVTDDPVAILESHNARCGQAGIVTRALLDALGISNREMPICHHTVTEAHYDGSWHIVDPLFFGDNQPHRDGRVLSVEELQHEPYFADAFPQPNLVFDPELLCSDDGFWVQGYVFGIWGSEPYYSYYLGAGKEHPPTLPMVLPVQRIAGDRVSLNWSRSLKMGGGPVEYDVRVYRDRACTDLTFQQSTDETSVPWQVERGNWMYFIEVRALDEQRAKNPHTWYPAARGNFVLAPEDQYGWYGVL